MAGKNVFDFDNVAFDQHTHLLIRTFRESFQSDRFQMLYLRPPCPQYYRPNIFCSRLQILYTLNLGISLLLHLPPNDFCKLVGINTNSDFLAFCIVHAILLFFVM